MKLTHCFLLTSMMLTYVSQSSAQKLPNKQDVSLWAPLNVRVDGRVTEWNNEFQAYNRATEVFYTIANDEKNLYLVIHAVKSRIIEKMIEGGVSFTLNNPSSKDASNKIVVLFPLMNMNKCRSILISAGKHLSEQSSDVLLNSVDPDVMQKRAISIAKANNELIDALKEIKISGVSSIIDTVAGVKPKSPYYINLPLRLHNFKIIGIDNNDGIEAMTQFGDDGTYNYELAIPIKYLQFYEKGLQKFSYNITLNSRGEDGRPGDVVKFSPPPNAGVVDIDLETPTDFSGEYTLAKKP